MMDFDFDTIRAQLEGGAGYGPDEDDADAWTDPSGWLHRSWKEPRRFWHALIHYYATLSSPAPKSHPGEGFDFYHDMVLRHRPERTALRIFSRQSGWRVYTYRDVDRRSTALAEDWQRHGLAAGDLVCLLLPEGEELVLALVTALRLGLRISYLPPRGAAFVKRRLAKLPGATVITLPFYLSSIGEARAVFVSDVMSAHSGGRQLLHSYPASGVAGLFFSDLIEASDAPLPLSAELLYMAALRDALLCLRLRPGDLTGAPGLSPLQHQPSLIIGAFLCGATWMHVAIEDLAEDPSLLTGQPLRAVGLSVAARDVLLRAGAGAQRGWSFWYRNPEEPFDVAAWQKLGRRLQLAEVAAGNLLVDASAGGSVLWSAGWRGRVHEHVWPAAGRPWSLLSSLSDGDGNGPPALGDHGLFVSEQPRRPPHVMLRRCGDRFTYAGTRSPRRGGRVYPAAEAVAIAGQLPQVLAATVVFDPDGRLGQPACILVVFTGADRPARDLERTLRDAVAAGLGADQLPDHIECVPLYPRRPQGVLDERWCAEQQLTCRLYRKARQPAYQLLTLLRRALDLDAASTESRPGATPS